MAKNSVNGILLIDKPLGKSSNQVLQIAKRAFNAQKAGHTGSLDPLATGMLPICFGEATKFSQYLLDADKCYRVTGRLGVKTSTSDAEGEIVSQVDATKVTLAQLHNVLESFVGDSLQVPSMFSALKKDGVPLYKLARQGREVERKARPITVYSIDLLDANLPFFSLKVSCSKGTYIRNLIEDIGEKLSVGAFVSQLHRIYSAPFQDMSMISLSEVSRLGEENSTTLFSQLLPIDSAVSGLKFLRLTDAQLRALVLGQRANLLESVPDDIYRLYDCSGCFQGLGEVFGETEIKSKRLLNTSSHKCMIY